MENQVYRQRRRHHPTANYPGHLVGYSATFLGLPTRNRFRRYQNGFWLLGAALTGAIAGPIPAMIHAAHDILKFALGGAKVSTSLVTP